MKFPIFEIKLSKLIQIQKTMGYNLSQIQLVNASFKGEWNS